MKKYTIAIPNIVTSIRLIGAIVIIFLELMSLEFLIVYGACGVTDCLDGFIARKFRLASKFGSILDSATDLVFLGVMGFKMFPIFMENLSIANWIMIIVPVALHVAGYIACAIKYKKFSSMHTYANKCMSAAIFFFPYTFIGNIHLIYDI